mmetsp:Transcript_65359/g.142450  ORF Transcript_65359/g.142450 Transcript_65359/m.142450 type:complete len:171 (-) Transcript_65359:218-730(-)
MGHEMAFDADEGTSQVDAQQPTGAVSMLRTKLFTVADYQVTVTDLLLFLFMCSYIVRGYYFFVGNKSAKTCTVRHILMKSSDDLEKAKKRIDKGEAFSKVAQECSTCPSGKKGGSLGWIKPGQMVPAFDKVCFDPETKVGEVIGPVQTHFGYHLVLVDERKGFESAKKTG